MALSSDILRVKVKRDYMHEVPCFTGQGSFLACFPERPEGQHISCGGSGKALAKARFKAAD